jgi:hypothetical protein
MTNHSTKDPFMPPRRRAGQLRKKSFAFSENNTYLPIIFSAYTISHLLKLMHPAEKGSSAKMVLLCPIGTKIRIFISRDTLLVADARIQNILTNDATLDLV